jgi:hypothetical protein
MQLSEAATAAAAVSPIPGMYPGNSWSFNNMPIGLEILQILISPQGSWFRFQFHLSNSDESLSW